MLSITTIQTQINYSAPENKEIKDAAEALRRADRLRNNRNVCVLQIDGGIFAYGSQGEYFHSEIAAIAAYIISQSPDQLDQLARWEELSQQISDAEQTEEPRSVNLERLRAQQHEFLLQFKVLTVGKPVVLYTDRVPCQNCGPLLERILDPKKDTILFAIPNPTDDEHAYLSAAFESIGDKKRYTIENLGKEFIEARLEAARGGKEFPTVENFFKKWHQGNFGAPYAGLVKFKVLTTEEKTGQPVSHKSEKQETSINHLLDAERDIERRKYKSVAAQLGEADSKLAQLDKKDKVKALGIINRIAASILDKIGAIRRTISSALTTSSSSSRSSLYFSSSSTDPEPSKSKPDQREKKELTGLKLLQANTAELGSKIIIAKSDVISLLRDAKNSIAKKWYGPAKTSLAEFERMLPFLNEFSDETEEKDDLMLELQQVENTLKLQVTTSSMASSSSSSSSSLSKKPDDQPLSDLQRMIGEIRKKISVEKVFSKVTEKFKETQEQLDSIKVSGGAEPPNNLYRYVIETFAEIHPLLVVELSGEMPRIRMLFLELEESIITREQELIDEATFTSTTSSSSSASSVSSSTSSVLSAPTELSTSSSSNTVTVKKDNPEIPKGNLADLAMLKNQVIELRQRIIGTAEVNPDTFMQCMDKVRTEILNGQYQSAGTLFIQAAPKITDLNKNAEIKEAISELDKIKTLIVAKTMKITALVSSLSSSSFIPPGSSVSSSSMSETDSRSSSLYSSVFTSQRHNEPHSLHQQKEELIELQKLYEIIINGLSKIREREAVSYLKEAGASINSGDFKQAKTFLNQFEETLALIKEFSDAASEKGGLEEEFEEVRKAFNEVMRPAKTPSSSGSTSTKRKKPGWSQEESSDLQELLTRLNGKIVDIENVQVIFDKAREKFQKAQKLFESIKQSGGAKPPDKIYKEVTDCLEEFATILANPDIKAEMPGIRTLFLDLQQDITRRERELEPELSDETKSLFFSHSSASVSSISDPSSILPKKDEDSTTLTKETLTDLKELKIYLLGLYRRISKTAEPTSEVSSRADQGLLSSTASILSSLSSPSLSSSSTPLSGIGGSKSSDSETSSAVAMDLVDEGPVGESIAPDNGGEEKDKPDQGGKRQKTAPTFGGGGSDT